MLRKRVIRNFGQHLQSGFVACLLAAWEAAGGATDLVVLGITLAWEGAGGATALEAAGVF